MIRLRVIEEGVDGLIWPRSGLQVLNKFTTENLMVMWFSERFLNEKGGIKTKQHLHDVTLPNDAKKLINFSEKES